MTQKQLITANNAELEKHKQDILSLPMADDVKNGRYVWGKYEVKLQSYVNPTITAVKESSGTMAFSSKAGIDFTKVDQSFLVGFVKSDGWKFEEESSKSLKLVNPKTGESRPNLHFYQEKGKIDGYAPAFYDSCFGEYKYDGVKQTLPQKTFLAYTVSDSETAYPDGGEKDGFWWERVKQGLSIAEMGFTKLTYGSFILSEDNTSSYTITHNLGAKLKKLIVYTEDSLVRNNYGIRQLSLVDRYTSYSGNGEEYYFQYGAYQKTNYLDREGFSTFEGAIHRSDVTTSKVTFRLDTVNYLVGGKKYYWMAMA